MPMDDDAALHDEEAERIRQQMNETRADLTEKLEVLEQQVVGTVETVKESVNTVQHVFDLKYQMQERPWAIMAGAAAVGLLVGYSTGRHVPRRDRGNGHVSHDAEESRNGDGILRGLSHTFQNELGQ